MICFSKSTRLFHYDGNTINVNYPFKGAHEKHEKIRARMAKRRSLKESKLNVYNLIHTNQIIMTIGRMCIVAVSSLWLFEWMGKRGRENTMKREREKKKKTKRLRAKNARRTYTDCTNTKAVSKY